MSRGATPTRAMTDTCYGAGRQSTTATRCFGCPTTLRRADRARIRLCSDCTRTVSFAYALRLAAAGIRPAVTDRRWSAAWEALRRAMASGDEDLIRALLAEGR